MNIREIKEKSEELFAQGLSEEEIAEELDLPLRGIQRVLEDYKLQMKKARVLPMREEGYTYNQISEIIGLSTRTIWKVLCQAGEVESRGPKKIDAEQKREIKYRYLIGDHPNDLAKEYEISPAYVYQIVSGIGPSKRGLEESERLAIAKDYLVDNLKPPAIALRRGVSINTVYSYRFADPILNAEWFIKHGLDYASQKKFVFDDAKIPMHVYWAIWFAHHREKHSYNAIVERMGFTYSEVVSIAAIRTESAYRAAWEMRVKERGYE